MQYFGGAASSMDHQHEFRQAGIFLRTSCHSGCTGRTSRAERRVAFPQLLLVFDDGKCTKLSPKKFFF